MFQTGRWQASRLSDRLKSSSYTHVFTSDLSRACATTAAIMRVNDSTADMITDGRLREQYYGVFENRTFQEWFSTYGSWEDTLGLSLNGFPLTALGKYARFGFKVSEK